MRRIGLHIAYAVKAVKLMDEFRMLGSRYTQRDYLFRTYFDFTVSVETNSAVPAYTEGGNFSCLHSREPAAYISAFFFNSYAAFAYIGAGISAQNRNGGAQRQAHSYNRQSHAVH